jgi:hypothetical protein
MCNPEQIIVKLPSALGLRLSAGQQQAASFGPGGCTLDTIKDSVSEWWVQLRTNKRITGWVLATTVNNSELRQDGNFGDLCPD